MRTWHGNGLKTGKRDVFMTVSIKKNPIGVTEILYKEKNKIEGKR